MKIGIVSVSVVAIAVIAAGCGDGQQGTAAVTSASVGVSGKSGGVVVAEDDRKAAEAAVLTINDMQAGSTAKGAVKSDVAAFTTSFRNTPDFLTCMGMEPSQLNRFGPWASSPTFTMPDGHISGSYVAFASAVEDAISGMREYRDSRFAACTLSSLRNQKVAGLTVDSVDALAFPELGDETIAYRTVVTISVNGTTIRGIQDAVVIRRGRVQVTMEFDSNDGTPFPIDRAEALARVVVSRLPK
ncbi:hypothetical protein ACFXHA_05730 [Nocardia sp. NPDC059240]|uniref:hypothetical protein n=1 Tax=Nocardia sp. NPDC059240 TaxID=3346786 RepID=UPI00368185B4